MVNYQGYVTYIDIKCAPFIFLFNNVRPDLRQTNILFYFFFVRINHNFLVAEMIVLKRKPTLVKRYVIC